MAPFKYILLATSVAFLFACTSANCREDRAQRGEVKNKAMDLSREVSSADTVKVFKYDGSLQCSTDSGVSLEQMKGQLGSAIDVLKSEKKPDGKMRASQCGLGTGICNVYTILKKDLDLAIKAGFQEWPWD